MAFTETPVHYERDDTEHLARTGAVTAASDDILIFMKFKISSPANTNILYFRNGEPSKFEFYQNTNGTMHIIAATNAPSSTVYVADDVLNVLIKLTTTSVDVYINGILEIDFTFSSRQWGHWNSLDIAQYPGYRSYDCDLSRFAMWAADVDASDEACPRLPL